MVKASSSSVPAMNVARIVKTTLTLLIISFLAPSYVEYLLPHGAAVYNEMHSNMTNVDFNIHNMDKDAGTIKKIYERLGPDQEPILIGPETIIFDPDGNMYGITKNGNVIQLLDFEPHPTDSSIITADVNILAAVTGGRALGGKFVPRIDSDKILYVAVAPLGLCRFNLSEPYPKMQVVASFVSTGKSHTDTQTSKSPILYADDIDIGPNTGHIYFSDASDVNPERIGLNDWDTMYAYKVDFLRSKPTGRLLRYKPETDEVDILASGIFFANGIAVDKSNEEFVVVAETSYSRVLKYHLKGPKKGSIEIVGGMTLSGFPDGIDCDMPTTNKDSDGRTVTKCYVALPSARLPLCDILWSPMISRRLEAILRTLILMVPKRFFPKTKRYGGVAELLSFGNVPDGTESSSSSSSSSSTATRVTRIHQDPTGENVKMITGVTVYDGKIYLGSLHNEYIGVYDVDSSDAP